MSDFSSRFCAARRACIARDFAKLNPEQRRGVLTTEGPLLLLAGAGSGKTTVLINRIANLLTYGRGSDCGEVPAGASEDDLAFLENYPAQPTADERRRMRQLCAVEPPAPWQVLAVTFTNKAAKELRERLEAFGIAGAGDIWALTFHSACVRILRRDIDKLGFSNDFTIYDTDDCKRVVKDILKEMDLDEKTFSPREVLSVISKAKDELLSPQDFSKKWAGSGDWKRERIAKIYARYDRILCEANALDFDDLILHTVRLLQNEAEVRDYYRHKFRYILIDEYQDTNRMQYELVRLLVDGHRNICVVGDDDQSIYRFRGADISNILNFEKEYKGTRTIRLEQNYRSTQNILDAANAVIKNNVGRKGKTLWTDAGSGEKVTVKTVFNEQDEANFVVSGMMTDFNRGKNWRDNAVLYRMNAQSNALEYALKRNGIPYQVVGGMKFFDRAEVKDMLAYLCVINNRADELRLQRIINNPPRGIGGKTLEMAQRQAAAADVPLYTVVSDPYSYPSLEKSAAKLMAFTVIIEECAELLQKLPLPDFYEEVMTRTGYLQMLEEKGDVESRTRAENVRELKSSILSYMENTETPTLAGFLEEIALYTDIEQYDPDADAVVMMTMHAAKGLEFPNVFLVGLEEGLFPSNRCMSEPEELEEERRLCYVAITRAKQHLVITYARQRMLYGRTTTNLPSRFVDELPAESVKRIGAPKPSYQQTEPRQYGSFGRVSIYGDSYNDFSQIPTRPKPQKDYSVHTAPKPAPKVSFAAGEMVQHKAFGRGMILTVLPMGNDALLEIAFDGVGTKRLMANTAAQHMKKL